jgi:hypothetical protein
MNQAEAFVLDQIPLVLRTKIPTALKTAYAAARAIIAEEAVLQVPTAEDNHGRIIQWAVDFGFHRLATSGEWPFEARWSWFEKPTGRYLELAASHSLITISQSADPKKQPRDVRFRENKRLSNQGVLAGFGDDDEAVLGLPHIILIHGYQQLDFAHLAVPNETHRKGWLYRTPIVAPELPAEDTDIEAVMTLKEEIDRWRRDNEQ